MSTRPPSVRLGLVATSVMATVALLSGCASAAPGGAADAPATPQAGGTLTYTSAANFSGSDTIRYTISDGNGGTATSVVTVTVNPVGEPPVVVAPSRATRKAMDRHAGLERSREELERTQGANIVELYKRVYGEGEAMIHG